MKFTGGIVTCFNTELLQYMYVKDDVSLAVMLLRTLQISLRISSTG